MASKREVLFDYAGEDMDRLIEGLKGLPGVICIYTRFAFPKGIVTAFVDSEETARAAMELEMQMAEDEPNLLVELHVYDSSPDELAAFREAVGTDGLEWSRDEFSA